MDERLLELEEQIFELIENRRFVQLKNLLSEMQPADIAEIFDEAKDKDIPVLFRILPKELAAEVFVEFDTDRQELLLNAFSDSELREVLDELFMEGKEEKLYIFSPLHYLARNFGYFVFGDSGFPVENPLYITWLNYMGNSIGNFKAISKPVWEPRIVKYIILL